MMKTSIMTLAMVSSGKKAKIVSIVGGRGIREHLVGMGLDVGLEIRVLKQGVPGPLLIAVGETRLAVGQGIAQKLIVSVEKSGGIEKP